MAPIVPIIVYGGLIATELGALVLTARNTGRILEALKKAEEERKELMSQIIIEED